MRIGFRGLALAGLVVMAGLYPDAALAQLRSNSTDGEELPPGFTGQITYRGTHQGVQDRGRRGSREFGGALTVVLSFDGNAVTGRISGTGGINSTSVSGTRTGNVCRLFEERAGDIIEGQCTRARFAATVRSQGNRNAVAARFDTETVEFQEGGRPR